MKNVIKNDQFARDVSRYFNDSRITSLAGGYSDPRYINVYRTCGNFGLNTFVPLIHLALTHTIYVYDDINAQMVKLFLDDAYIKRIETEFFIPTLSRNLPIRIRKTDGRIISDDGLYIGILYEKDINCKFIFKLRKENPIDEINRLVCAASMYQLDNCKPSQYDIRINQINGMIDEIEAAFNAETFSFVKPGTEFKMNVQRAVDYYKSASDD